MAGLGSLKKLENAFKVAADAARSEKPAQKMSEALNPHVGKRLYITQADRTALDYPQGLLGGPGYTELANIDPTKYKDIAWAVQTPGIAKTMVGSMAKNPEEAIWTNLIGSPTQHKSNKVVFDRIMKQFTDAVAEDKLTPELHKKINDRLANIKDPKTGKAYFPEDVDVLSPEFINHTTTFHQRGIIADTLAGKGVGGEKGTIIDFPRAIAETTDPYLLGAQTGDIGDRLFSLSGNIEHRPELHPAFHTSLSGRRESEAFKPAPQDIVLQDFIKDFTERTGRMPTYYDLTRGYAPNVKVTDEMLENLSKAGHKDGGHIKPLELNIPKLKEGNFVSRAMEGYRKSAEFLKNLGIQAYDEAKEELPTLLHPRAIPDIVANVGAGIAGIPSDIMNLVIPPLNEEEVPNYKPALGSEDLQERLKQSGITTGTERPLIEGIATLASPRGIAKTGKSLVKEVGRQIDTGTGFIGRNVINPRHNIIKDPGGMLVGGERELDNELASMKKWAPNSPEPTVALNNWVDTKVKKYIRNQAGTENDPILKAIESGVEHNFAPLTGDSKYYVANQRASVGKPVEGIAKTDLGKEWEYKVDSTFSPKKSADIKEILNSPMEYADPATANRRKASLLRVEQDLPINNEQDLEALKLINQIPDENVYTIGASNITNRLGLNHVADVLYEDLASGRLKPEQLNQMSIEKAVRRTAEYDAQKAKEMEKAHATSVEGMPVPKQYDDGYKWVELKHSTDAEKTKGALKSEGEMMGHCVGGPGYCQDVLGGHTQIFSLRGPDNKSHVTIEATKHSHLNSWLDANKEEISKDPLLQQMAHAEPDVQNYYSKEEEDAARITDIAKMLRMKGAPIKEDPNAWIELQQIKGKQNKRPDDKYQKYVEDFIKNNPTGHEITDIHELNNTNLHNVQELVAQGLVPKDVHFHPDVVKALESTVPNYHKQTPLLKDEYTYGLVKGIAKDFARKNQYYISNEDIINAAKEKHLNKAKGGAIDLETEFKLRRRYG